MKTIIILVILNLSVITIRYKDKNHIYSRIKLLKGLS